MEGSLEAPTRHPIDWQNSDFFDKTKLHDELERVFDICHGCRRCFNLCSSFPTLFDLIDESESGELDTVDKNDYKKVVDGCTLCDMCFMTKCPYVPPHEFDLDFPHLMLRYRAVEHQDGLTKFTVKELTKTDRNGKLGNALSKPANWATKRDNSITRPVLEKIAGVHKQAELPPFSAKSLEAQAKTTPLTINKDAPAYGEKVAIYATCYGNYNTPEVGMALRQILAHNGVESEIIYPECCGMPQLEQGDLKTVAGKAKTVALAFKPWIEKGYTILASVPSCALMMKFEWPLILPDDEDVKSLSNATQDASEYIVKLNAKYGLCEGLKPLDGEMALHIACHSRAQNMGQKGAELLRLIPDGKLNVVERCSGHGGSWGIMKGNFDIGLKQGKPVYRKMNNQGQAKYIISECPLASLHIAQGVENEKRDEHTKPPETVPHPIVLLARAYGF